MGVFYWFAPHESHSHETDAEQEQQRGFSFCLMLFGLLTVNDNEAITSEMVLCASKTQGQKLTQISRRLYFPFRLCGYERIRGQLKQSKWLILRNRSASSLRAEHQESGVEFAGWCCTGRKGSAFKCWYRYKA